MLAPKVLRCLVYHHRQQVHQLGPVHGGLTSDYAPVHVVGLQVAPGGRQGPLSGHELAGRTGPDVGHGVAQLLHVVQVA